MPPAPPRRPRRWSWACTGTLVRVGMAFALAAMVAMPERHVAALVLPDHPTVDDIAANAEARGMHVLRGRGSPRDVVGTTRDRNYVVSRWPLDNGGARAYTDYVPPSFSVSYRDSGPHLLLNGFWEWLTL